MTGRLGIDHVSVQLGDGVVVLSWAERGELLARLEPIPGAAALVARFTDVGTRTAVVLDGGEVELLTGVLLAWQEGGGRPASDGLRALAAMLWSVRSGD